MTRTRRETGYQLDISNKFDKLESWSDQSGQSDQLDDKLIILKVPTLGKQASQTLQHRRLGYLNIQDVKKLASIAEGIDIQKATLL